MKFTGWLEANIGPCGASLASFAWTPAPSRSISKRRRPRRSAALARRSSMPLSRSLPNCSNRTRTLRASSSAIVFEPPAIPAATASCASTCSACVWLVPPRAPSCAWNRRPASALRLIGATSERSTIRATSASSTPSPWSKLTAGCSMSNSPTRRASRPSCARISTPSRPWAAWPESAGTTTF